ncbi:hypothetical protein QFZ23_004337 [Arthrobacter globiformis]|nr:hypothetical protein [Arthrobacter globiformis]
MAINTASFGLAPESRVKSHWRPVSWDALAEGQDVRITRGGRYITYGTIDCATPDGSLVWIVLKDLGERRVFYRIDGVSLEIN